MANELRGKVALVTGGAIRLGRSICEALADAGANVAVHYRTSAVAAAELVQRLQRKGRKAEAIPADLRTELACEGLVAETVHRLGRIDLLVNSAAVFNRDSVATLSESSLMEEFWPNLFAPVLLTKAFAASCREGAVVNILDRRIRAHDAARIPYMMTKKALEEFTQVAAIDLGPRIRVNGVSPGPILPPPGESPAYLKEKGGRILTPARPTPEAVARAVVFLATSDSITGQVIFVDGGQHLLGNGV